MFGGELVAVSDIDPGANRILAHRYPNVPNLGDLKFIDWDARAGVEIITAGYPCQPFSNAGKRAGTDDPRHIFPNIAEGIRRVGPRLVLLENVRGHLRLGFDVVLGTLADVGYDARWVCIRASDVGACHKRERLFIAATPRDSNSAGLEEHWHPRVLRQASGPTRATPHGAGAPLDLLPTPRTSDTNGSGQHGDGGLDLRTAVELLPTPAVNDMGAGKTVEAWDEWTARMKAEHGNGNGHGPSLSIEALRLLPTPVTEPLTGNGHARNLGAEIRVFGKYAAAVARQEAAFGYPAPPPTQPTGKGGAHRLSPAFMEWMMGCEPGWVTDPDVGLTRTQQLKALGNGVVRQQAAAAIRYITTPLAVAA